MCNVQPLCIILRAYDMYDSPNIGSTANKTIIKIVHFVKKKNNKTVNVCSYQTINKMLNLRLCKNVNHAE